MAIYGPITEAEAKRNERQEAELAGQEPAPNSSSGGNGGLGTTARRSIARIDVRVLWLWVH